MRSVLGIVSIRPHTLRVLGTACAAVLAIILTLGLWPFHAPRNNVKWLKQANGLLFKKYGTAFSLFGIPPSQAPDSSSRTIEVWLRAEPWQSGSFLSFYNPETSLAVSMRESLTDFELIAYNPRSHQLNKAHFYADDVFDRSERTFIAVTVGKAGIKIYVNGSMAAQGRSLSIERAFEGRLIAGDAPFHTDTWRGEIRGIAIYDAELPETRIVRHYQIWKDRRRPNKLDLDHISHLYLMDERGGNTIHDKVKPVIELVIPTHYTVIGKLSLEPIWNEFEFSANFARSALKNIIGFVPLGICCYLFVLICEWKRPILKVILVGFSVSLTIEVLQILLPTRDSGMTDLITNTLGTWVGIRACQWIGPSRLISYYLTLSDGVGSERYSE